MSKLQEYRKLSADVKAARKDLCELEQEITSHQDVYDLNGKNNRCLACITMFDKVKLPNGQINDEGGIKKFCDHMYGNQVSCDEYGCSCTQQADRFRYLKLEQVLADAIAARCAFVRNVLRIKKLTK